MIKNLILFILVTTQVMAGLPPTTTRGSADSAPVTTFNIHAPNIPITHSGVTATIGTIPIAGGGTGQTSKAAAFDALSPMTTGGDLIYGGASGTGTRLANGAQYSLLTSSGGTAAPTWSLLGNNNIAAAAGIDATKIADGTVTSTEFQYINSLTSNAQTQLDGKASTSLNNLIATQIGVALEPYATGLVDIGSTSFRWNNGYINNLNPTQLNGVAIGNYLTTTNTAAVTNKDYDGGTATNTSRLTLPKANSAAAAALTRKQGTIIYDTSLSLPAIDDGTTLNYLGKTPVGSDNYILNYDAEVNATGWTTYSGGTTSPTSGTGGSPNSTWARSIASPLKGTGSFLLTLKTGASRQGEGVCNTITLPFADTENPKVQQTEFSYRVASGTFAAGNPNDRTSAGDSDLTVWIVDTTSGQVIQPSTYRLYSNTSDRFIGNWQNNKGSASYRVCIHKGTSTTVSGTNITVQFDQFRTAPAEYVYGTPVTDWTSYTYTGFTSTNGVMNSKWRRVGDMMEVMQSMEWSNTAGAFSGNFGIPSGYTIDTAKLPLSTVAVDRTIVGRGTALDSGLFIYDVMVTYRDTTTVNVWSLDVNTVGYGRNTNLTNTAPFTIAASDNISIRYSVPITGWSSSVQQSDGFNARNVILNTARNTGLIGTSAGTWSTLTFSSATDLTGSWNGSDTWTCPTSDWYRIKVFASQFTNAAQYFDVGYRINGGSDVLLNRGFGTATASAVVSGTDTVYLTAGQTIQGRAATEGTQGINLRQMSIERIQAPTTMSATDIVAARYTTSSQALGNATIDTVILTTKDFDTHNAYSTSTGLFTCPVAGFYSVQFISSPGIRSSATWDFTNYIYVNSTNKIDALMYSAFASGIHLMIPTVATTVYCAAGDTISGRARAGYAGQSLNGNATENVISIFRVK